MKRYKAITFVILSLISVYVSGQNFVPTKTKQAITDFDGVEIPAGSLQLTDWKAAILSKFFEENADVLYYKWDEKTKACSLYVVRYKITESNEMGGPEYLTLYLLFADDFEDCKRSGVIPKFITKEYYHQGKPWEKEYANIYTDPYHTKCGYGFDEYRIRLKRGGGNVSIICSVSCIGINIKKTSNFFKGKIMIYGRVCIYPSIIPNIKPRSG